MVAADDVAVGGHQHARTDRDAAGREDLAVEADVRAVGQLDVAVLAGQDRVAPDEHAVADPDAPVRLALRVEQAVVVDDDVVADVNLVRVAQDDVLAEDDVAAAGARAAEGTAVLRSARPSAPARACASITTNSYFSSAPRPGRPTTSVGVLRAAADLPGREELILRLVDRLQSHPCATIPVQRAPDALAQADLRRVPDFLPRPRDVEGAALGEEVDAAPVERRLDAEAARTPPRTAAPATQNGHDRQMQPSAARTPATSATSATSSLSVVTSPPARM